MKSVQTPAHLLIIDIDGLRQDVFFSALEQRRLPRLGALLGGRDATRGLHLEAVAPAPSITFTSQTSIFTGLHPDEHGIAGNQYFDRFGSRNGGKARFYAFDIGDTLAVDDAVAVFSGKPGLLNQALPEGQTTLYERAAMIGLTARVANHMLARGARHWQRPRLTEIARFTKGGGLLGLSAEKYDRRMIRRLLRPAARGRLPAVMTAYFMGLDHHSHEHGPAVQPAYLADVVDPQVGVLLDGLAPLGWLRDALVVVVSDHGQIAVIPDDRHSLRLSFPFDREMGYLFDALHLDVHDKPGEDPNCDAVVACNGGLAHVYLQNRAGAWRDRPRFEQDVQPVARAFWEANQSGRYAEDLHGALSGILARDVEREGWQAPYRAWTPEGLFPAAEWLASRGVPAIDAEARLAHLAGETSGDLLLIANYAEGFYFGSPTTGIHGGLHPEDSRAVLSFGWQGGSPSQLAHLRETVNCVVQERMHRDGREYPSVTDMLPAVGALFGWG